MAQRLAADRQDGSVKVDAGTHEVRRHRRQPRQTGTAAQRQQQGFDLIVRMLRQNNVFDSTNPSQFAEFGVSGFASPIFRAGA